MVTSKRKSHKLTGRELALVIAVGALPVAILGPALIAISTR